MIHRGTSLRDSFASPSDHVFFSGPQMRLTLVKDLSVRLLVFMSLLARPANKTDGLASDSTVERNDTDVSAAAASYLDRSSMTYDRNVNCALLR